MCVYRKPNEEIAMPDYTCQTNFSKRSFRSLISLYSICMFVLVMPVWAVNLVLVWALY